MRKGDSIRYFWQTDGAEIRYELHGERIGAAEGEYSSYQKGSATGEHGNFTAPFDGTHGWYWKNRSDQPIAITVNASGAFESLEAKP
ncbi:putative transmembrane anchor protein [Exiguobacterium sp. S17]|nr:putative transmembrane anchor protein [Exiguobacterium sp. S17]